MAWAITGAGMLTSVGQGVDACFRALCAGTSGVKPLQAFDAARYDVQRAYEIEDREGGRDVPRRSSRWLCAAIAEAVASAGLSPDAARPLPILVGTGLRELRSLELWWSGAPLELHELHFGGALHEAQGARGPVITVCNACAASSFALGLAEDMLALGQADAVIVAGCDSITESMFGLADRANPGGRPERLQPFDRDRRGVVLGEGAAAVVLERPDRAASRGAPPLAWLRGVGMSCDAYHETAPSLDGVQRAMRDAHRRSGVSAGEIDLLMAHGTGTSLNDENEIQALRGVFGARAPSVMISGIKSMTGHTSGGSGLVGVITAIQSMIHGRVPPTVGLSRPLDAGEGLDFVTGAAREAAIRVAQVDAFGFGGVNAVAILERRSA